MSHRWKTSPSLEHPQRFANPLWSYSLGLAQGWLPQNPRRSAGFCYDYAQENQLMAGMPRRRMRKPPGEMEGWKVGRYDSQGRQKVVPTDEENDSARYPWPPKYFLLDPMSAPASFDEMNPKLEVARLPRYAETTTSFSLPGPPPSFTLDSPKGSWHVPVAGCDYPETWNSANSTGWSETCLSPT
jgi:glucan 1,3-beta-glucosidase